MTTTSTDTASHERTCPLCKGVGVVSKDSDAKGGLARAAKLTPERRSEIAKKASQAAQVARERKQTASLAREA